MSDTPYIGALNEPIVVEFYYSEKKDSGEEVKTWTDYINTRAAVKFGSVGENENNEQIAANDKVDFTIRMHTGINRKMRVLWNNEVYDIQGIKHLSRRFITLSTKLNREPDNYIAPGYVNAENVQY